MGKHNPYPQKHRPKSSRKGGKLLLQELLESKPKHPVAFVNTLPYKSLRKHVLWLSLPQQDAMEDVTLTNELECFAQYVKMDQSEQAARSFMIDDITRAIRNVFPSAQVRPFGSYAVSLSTFLSDVDVTVEHLENAVPPAQISISSTDKTASDVAGASPNKRQRRNETVPAVNLTKSTILTKKLDSTCSRNTHLQLVRDNLEKLPMSASNDAKSVHQVVDLTVDTTSSEQCNGAQSLKRRHTQFERDSGSGYKVSSTVEDRVGLSDADLAEAYALADALDRANNQNNSRSSAGDAADAVLTDSTEGDYWHSHSDIAESLEYSDNSKTSFSPIKTSASSSDSLQRQADIEGIQAPRFSYARDEPRQNKVARLQRIFDELQDQSWTHRVEFRRHARVPIINLTHNNSVDCDISLNTPEESTSLVVRALLQRCGPALVKLSAFLKIYLNQLSLDAPFTGGLGSYKLYVLLAKHIEDHPQVVGSLSNPCLGSLLISFLRYYGARKNLNADTEIALEGAETVAFNRTAKVHEIQLAFEKAYVVLVKAQQKGKSSSSGANISQISSSVLAGLLNTEHLSKLRSRSQAFCASYLQRRQARLGGAISGIGVPAREQQDISAESAFGDKVSLSQQLEVLRSNIQDAARQMQSALSGSVPTPPPPPLSNAVASPPPLPLQAAPTRSSSNPADHQLVTDDPRAVFNPSDDVGRKIISGELALPAYMLVADDHKLYLPQSTQLRLGPFRSLAISARYTSKTFDELRATLSAEESNIAGWLEQHRKSTGDHKPVLACAFSPLTVQGKLILAGAIPVPTGMRLSDKQLRAVELAKHCREGLIKLIQQRGGNMKGEAEVASSVTTARSSGIWGPQKEKSRPPTPEEEQLAVEAAVDAMMAAKRSGTSSPQPMSHASVDTDRKPPKCVPAPARAQVPAGDQQPKKLPKLSRAHNSGGGVNTLRQQGVVDGGALGIDGPARCQDMRSSQHPGWSQDCAAGALEQVFPSLSSCPSLQDKVEFAECKSSGFVCESEVGVETCVRRATSHQQVTERSGVDAIASESASDQGTAVEEVASTAGSTMSSADSETGAVIDRPQPLPAGPPVRAKGAKAKARRAAQRSAELLRQATARSAQADLQQEAIPRVPTSLPSLPVPVAAPVPLPMPAIAVSKQKKRQQQQQHALVPVPPRTARAVTPPPRNNSALYQVPIPVPPHMPLIAQYHPQSTLRQSSQFNTFSYYGGPDLYPQQPAFAQLQSQPVSQQPVSEYSLHHQPHQPHQPQQPPPPQEAHVLDNPAQHMYYAIHSAPQPDTARGLPLQAIYQHWPAEHAVTSQPQLAYSQQVPTTYPGYHVASSAAPAPIDCNASAAVQMQTSPSSAPTPQYPCYMGQHSLAPMALPWAAELPQWQWQNHQQPLQWQSLQEPSQQTHHVYQVHQGQHQHAENHTTPPSTQGFTQWATPARLPGHEQGPVHGPPLYDAQAQHWCAAHPLQYTHDQQPLPQPQQSQQQQQQQQQQPYHHDQPQDLWPPQSW